MNNDDPDRMKFFRGENEAQAQRPKAQQEAARKNDARSRGPSIVDGEVRSRKNVISRQRSRCPLDKRHSTPRGLGFRSCH